MELRTHQSQNRDRLISILGSNGAALDASDTGTGKSFTAMSVVHKLQAQPAIICPKVCIPQWARLSAAFGVEPVFIANYEKCRAASFKHGGFTKVNREGSKSGYVWKPEGRVVFIWDEVQRCKSQGSQNSKMLLPAASKYKNLLLSATPFTSPLEAFSIGSTLRLFPQNQYMYWCFKHRVRKNYFGHFEFKGGIEDMERINAEIFPSRGVRTRHADIPGFPQSILIPTAVEVDDPSAIEKVYLDELNARRAADKQKVVDQITDAAIANGYFENLPEDWTDDVQPLAITVDLRARQEAEILKVNAMIELAKDALDKNESVAIFVNFDTTINILSKKLETTCILRGQRRKDGNNFDPVNSVRAFQSNRSPIILVNSAAGGVGVDLHDPVTKKARTTIISPPWSALILRQVLGRTKRDGGGYSTQRLVFAAGTIEERVMTRVQAVSDNLDALVDADLDPLNE